MPKTRNETRPSGGSGPLILSRRSLLPCSLAAHTADELECDAHGRAPLGWRGGCMMPAILSECVDGRLSGHLSGAGQASLDEAGAVVPEGETKGVVRSRKMAAQAPMRVWSAVGSWAPKWV